MMIVGLTGGIGSGKTTVAKLFNKLGVPVYNSDKEAKQLMNTSKKLREQIKAIFGEEAYEKKTLNRVFLAGKVFTDTVLLKKLNAIVHPAVREHFKAWVAAQNSSYVIQESALIFEHNNQNFYDKIILVTAPKALKIDRILNRDSHQKKAQIEQRMANQLLDHEKIKLSDYVIENIEIKNTEKRVLALHEVFINCN